MTQASRSDPSLSTGLANRTGPTGDLVPGEDRAGFASLPLSLAVQLEMVCGRFEDAWRATSKGGSEPRPEDYLASTPEEGHPALLRELVRIDLAWRRETGRSPEPEEYQQRFPDLDRGWLLGALTAAAALTTPPTTPGQPETPTANTAVTQDLPGGWTPIPLPARFDDYELLEEIARGGMGVVYKARQISLKRSVAVKMILAGGPVSTESVERFHREARAAAALDHPNIVAIHASGQQGGRPFFVMSYVEGENLREVVRRRGLLPPQQIVDVLRAVAEAVGFAHRHGIIHRDLKPENVLLDRQGRPRITDFGLAYQPDAPAEGDRLTHAGQVLGTPSYMAPEQAMSKHDLIGPTTDVYSLGGILYFLLTGQPPFQGRTATEVLCRVVTEAPVPPRQLNPEAPAALEAICLRCLEKDRGLRYPTAEALAEALREAMQPPVPSVEPAPLPTKKPGSSRRRWVGPAIVALVGIAAAVGLAIAAWGPWKGKAPASSDDPPTTFRPDSPAGNTAGVAADPGLGGAAAQLAVPPPELPKELRKDLKLEVAMLGKGPPGQGWLELKPAEGDLYRVRQGLDIVKFRIKVDQDAYVGIWAIDADGTIVELFPDEDEPNNLFRKDQERQVPRGPVDAVVSKGTDWVWVVASTKPWPAVQGERDRGRQVFRLPQHREKWEARQRGFRRQNRTVAEALLKFQVDP
jgi:serine/threonine protein kinase